VGAVAAVSESGGGRERERESSGGKR